MTTDLVETLEARVRRAAQKRHVQLDGDGVSTLHNPAFAAALERLDQDEALFVACYVATFDPKFASAASGLKTCSSPSMRHALRAGLASRSESMQLVASTIVAEVANIAFSNIARVQDTVFETGSLRDIPDAVARCIKSIKRIPAKYDARGNKLEETSYEVTLHDKLAALTLLHKMMGGAPVRSDDFEGAAGGVNPDSVELVILKRDELDAEDLQPEDDDEA